MRVILMLQFKKSFFEVFNKACFISTLSPQKLEAFKYSYSSKVKTQKASREWNREIWFHNEKVFKHLTS